MRRVILLMGLAIGLSTPCWALTLWGIDINGLELESSIWYINNTVEDSGVSPVVNTIGVSVPFRFLGHWLFRPDIQFFLANYTYQNGRAVPEDSMWDNVVILGGMINAVGGYEFPLNPNLSLAAEGGLGFLTRAPVFFNGTTASSMALPITGWLLAGRFLYPNVGTGLTWQFSQTFAATLRLQAFYPIFNLWDGLPWNDELTLGGGIGIRFTF